jgi:hypothetical protein
VKADVQERLGVGISDGVEDGPGVRVEQQRLCAAYLERLHRGDRQPDLHTLADESAAMPISWHQVQLSIPQPSNDKPLPNDLFVQTAPL